MAWKKGFCWNTKPEAEAHIKSLKTVKYGIIKKRVFIGSKIIEKKGKFCTKFKESKGYHRWLKTGK